MIDLIKEESDIEFQNWSSSKLVDYIVERHHRYVDEHLPIILHFASKVVKKYSRSIPMTIELYELITMLADDLSHHMQKEELVLFPMICNHSDYISNSNSFRDPLSTMEVEHEEAIEIYKRIKKLTNNYQLPKGVCSMFETLYLHLQEFEADLHLHIHLENNVLFPKVKGLAIRMAELG